MSERISEVVPERMSDRMSGDLQRMSGRISEAFPQDVACLKHRYKQLRGGGGDEADVKSNNNAGPQVHNGGDVNVAVLTCHGGDRSK